MDSLFPTIKLLQTNALKLCQNLGSVLLALISLGFAYSCTTQHPIVAEGYKTTKVMQSDRDHAAEIYKDKKRPLSERQAAFDALLETFTSGTPADVIRDYIDDETVTSRVLPPEDGDVFQISFDAPDGSRRWITLVGDNVE